MSTVSAACHPSSSDCSYETHNGIVVAAHPLRFTFAPTDPELTEMLFVESLVEFCLPAYPYRVAS